MRILNRYITREFLATFAISLLVFLFVMAIGNLFKVVDWLARGVSARLILKIFCYGMPFSMIFAIPMSALAAAFLNFSRMASDGEIAAMQACGVSIGQILQRPVLISVLLCGICVYINNDLAPASHFARRQVLSEAGIETPLHLLDEGRFIRDFPGYTIYIGRKEGYQIHDVVIYEFGQHGARQTVRATHGVIKLMEDAGQKIAITLYKVRIEQADEGDPANLQAVRRFTAEEYPLVFDAAELMRRGVVWKKRADLSMREILKALYGDLRFAPGDLLDLPGLVQRLRQPPFAEAAGQIFAPTTRLLLRVAAVETNDLSFLRVPLMEEFNRLLEGPAIYSDHIFKDVKLSRRTQDLLQRKPTGDDLVRLNRMLLEDLFAGLLARHYLSNLDDDDYRVHRMSLKVEASTRLALSFACFAFVLLGAALGLRLRRRESTIGMALSLGLVFVFYLFIVLADSLVGHPQWQPHLIVWIPFVIAETAGWFMLRRGG